MTLTPRLTAMRGERCPYCNITMRGTKNRLDSPTRDHIVPRSRAGKRTIIVCRRCNQDKADRDLEEWLGVLEETRDLRRRSVSILLGRLDRFEVMFTDHTASGLWSPVGAFA